jgi:hypothetical protein
MGGGNQRDNYNRNSSSTSPMKQKSEI